MRPAASGELLDEIHQVLTWPATEEQIERAMMVPDDVVQLITASGTPEEVRAKVRANMWRRAAPARCCIHWGTTSG